MTSAGSRSQRNDVEDLVGGCVASWIESQRRHHTGHGEQVHEVRVAPPPDRVGSLFGRGGPAEGDDHAPVR